MEYNQHCHTRLSLVFMAKTDVLIKHRNCIQTQKSIWNSQVSLPAVTPFPSLGGKHISVHQRLSSWGRIPRGSSDVLGADEGKGNLTLPCPPPPPPRPTGSFLRHCYFNWNRDGFSCNPRSPENHISLHTQLSFSRGLRSQKDEGSLSNAERTRSGLLSGSPLPNGIRLKLSACSLLCPSQSGPEGLPSFSLGKKECGVSHFIAMSHSFVPGVLWSAWRTPIYAGRIS